MEVRLTYHGDGKWRVHAGGCSWLEANYSKAFFWIKNRMYVDINDVVDYVLND